MPRIVTLRAKGQSESEVISLTLSQDAISAGPDGNPWCGVTLNPDQAPSLAQRLCSIATEIENGEESGHRTSALFFEHVSSIVVLHDGSEQSHRAFQAALQCASRSFGTLDLIGIVGFESQGPAARAMSDDSAVETRTCLSVLKNAKGSEESQPFCIIVRVI